MPDRKVKKATRETLVIPAHKDRKVKLGHRDPREKKVKMEKLDLRDLQD
jgi:hypothetical protein